MISLSLYLSLSSCTLDIDVICSGAQTPDMIPMMIKGGYRALAVAFDVWGLAGLVAEGMKKAKEIVNSNDEPNGIPVRNGVDGK